MQACARTDEGLGPVAGFFQGLAGLAFAAGEDEPMGFRVLYAVEHGLGGAGVVLAGLACPEAEFEAAFIGQPETLVFQKVAFEVAAITF